MKNFDEWNDFKKHIDSNVDFINVKVGEVWWSAVGVNVGSEQDGKNNNYERPVLVLKKLNNDLFLSLPLTSKYKDFKSFKKFKYIKNEEVE